MCTDNVVSMWFRGLLLISTATLVLGCASAPSPPSAGVAQAPDSVTLPAKPARFAARDELGLTITESVRISSEARAEYAAALQLLEQGELRQGIAALQGVVERAPGLTAPHINLGVAHAQSGDMQRAEESLKHALLLTPDHPVALNELGIVYRKTGRFAAARQSYEQALGVLNSFHYAQRNLAVLCDVFLEDLGCALQNYQAYQQAFPDDGEVAIWIAHVENRMAAHTGAVAAGESTQEASK